MGSKCDYLENKVLDVVVNSIAFATPGAVWSALFTAIPTDASGGTEVTDSSYLRVRTSFCTAGATTAGQVTTTGACTFATCNTAYTVVGWALFDASVAGNMLYWATVTTLAIGNGDQATFGVGNITITED